VADVGLGRVGIVFGIEVSRLARNNSDWYQLLDLCALTDTLIADTDGVYHPADFNDRLVLGLKGTMSEAELHLIRSRLTAGLRHKAARGELRQFLPVGFDYDENGAAVITPDEAVVEAIATVFRRFAELGTGRQVLLSLRGDGLLLPRRPTRTGRVHWAPATYPAVHDLLTNPVWRASQIPDMGPNRVPFRKWRNYMSERRKSFSSEFKDEAVKTVIEGSRAVADVARELGIGAETLRTWVNRYRVEHADEEPPLPISERARLRELEKENRELKMKAEFLGKAAAFFAQEYR
jgi:transposase-like protein